MRWVAGLLLMLAAALKAVTLVIDPATALVHPLGLYFLPLEIGLEFCVGLLFLSGIYWLKLRWLAAALFTAFSAYSLYLALQGATSCGCFGPVHVNPWWTFGLDLAVVLGLVASRWFDAASMPRALHSRAGLPSQLRSSSRVSVAVVISIGVLIAAALFRYADQRTAMANSISAAQGDLVILEPEKWIGQKLPIAEFIDTDLSSGEWIAVLHRHDCPVCQEAIPRYEQLASEGARIALIELPPYGFTPSLESACRCCRLKNDREWFVQTPVELCVKDGVVTTVKTYEH
jgi:hypothetical protein